MTQGKHISTMTLEELFKENTSGILPVLADIVHDNIVWGDGSLGQENGHLRLINDTATVKYKDKVYMPSHFTFTLPQEDGKKVGNTNITVSAIDQRIIEVIRSINDVPPRLNIDTFFCPMNVEGRTGYTFSPLGHYEFLMTNARWNETTAQWDLTFDPAMGVNIPADGANELRCPAVNKQ